MKCKKEGPVFETRRKSQCKKSQFNKKKVKSWSKMQTTMNAECFIQCRLNYTTE